MFTEALTLPLDITWRRLAFSLDMVDASFGDLVLPPKWRSSMAVYHYVVPEEQTAESYPDSRIVYLKVTCSLTGWNPSEDIRGAVDVDEAGDELDDLQRSTWQAIRGEGWAEQYWPCLGAIVQVALYPAQDDEDVAADDFPSIINVEPKKRELYETRSETGEFLSGTTNQVGVRKGTTDTKSTEESNILTGGSAGFQVGKIGGSASVSGEWGTRERTGTETVDMTTSDASRERRETLSHSTSFNQLYQLLSAYHLGTNRCVFLVAPRPHIVSSDTGQVDFNLLDGNRKLEGIQDFLLIVELPRRLAGLCLQASLDTGHTVRTTFGALKMRRRDDDHLPGGEVPPGYDPPEPPEQDDPLPEGEADPGDMIVERLVVTRRVVRTCAAFTDEGRLEPTGPGPEPPGEPQVPVTYEDIVGEGMLEQTLMARTGESPDPVRGQQLIADQRNRFTRRVMQSMLSGFSAGSYKPRAFIETSTARTLAAVTLRRSRLTMDELVRKGLVSEDERRLLGAVDTVGELFEPKTAIIDDSAGTRSKLMRDVRQRITGFVMQPAVR